MQKNKMASQMYWSLGMFFQQATEIEFITNIF